MQAIILIGMAFEILVQGEQCFDGAARYHESWGWECRVRDALALQRLGGALEHTVRRGLTEQECLEGLRWESWRNLSEPVSQYYPETLRREGKE